MPLDKEDYELFSERLGGIQFVLDGILDELKRLNDNLEKALASEKLLGPGALQRLAPMPEKADEDHG